MHIHPPKPLHGWRELLGEIGVIVIGVCIALAAEQAVEWLHWRKEMAETREALKTELTRATGSFHYRLDRQACAERRLDELTRWLDASKAGDTPPMTRPVGYPSGYVILTGAWDSGGEVAWRMPLSERLRFAHIYGVLGVFNARVASDLEGWERLDYYTAAEPLGPQDRIEMRGLIAKARRTGVGLRTYESFIDADTVALGVTPERRPFIAPVNDESFCQPLFAEKVALQAR